MSLSHWEYDTYFRDLDVAVIGGGIVGLNAAWALRRARPDLRVVVFERGSLPYGASTRNAGFACFGSVTEVMDDLERMPEAEVRALMARRYQGLRRVRENLGDDAIGYEPLGGWELIADDATMARCLAFLPTLNAWAAEFTDQPEAYADGTAHLAEFGFGGTRHLIHNRAEGLVHTGHMMDALMRQAVASGVSLCHGAWVERMDEDGGGVELHTQPFGPVRARRAVVCTNGFARRQNPHGQLRAWADGLPRQQYRRLGRSALDNAVRRSGKPHHPHHAARVHNQVRLFHGGGWGRVLHGPRHRGSSWLPHHLYV